MIKPFAVSVFLTSALTSALFIWATWFDHGLDPKKPSPGHRDLNNDAHAAVTPEIVQRPPVEVQASRSEARMTTPASSPSQTTAPAQTPSLPESVAPPRVIDAGDGLHPLVTSEKAVMMESAPADIDPAQQAQLDEAARARQPVRHH